MLSSTFPAARPPVRRAFAIMRRMNSMAETNAPSNLEASVRQGWDACGLPAENAADFSDGCEQERAAVILA
jgi:hypothetical protein